jgi:hypothetical protein
LTDGSGSTTIELPPMYLFGLQAEQVSPPSYDLVCTARVRWSYGDQSSDVIEFWWKGGSSNQWWRIDPVFAVDEDDPITEADIVVPAGVPGLIIACPRLVGDSGALEYRQPDDDGEEQIWNGFCLFTQFVGERLEGAPRDRCRTAPEITEMEVGFGTLTVRWTNPEGYDRFDVDFAGPSGNPRTYSTENQEYRFEKLASAVYWSRVVGVHDANEWTGSRECRSPRSQIREMGVPPELGYVEASFEPGAPLGIARQNSDHAELFGCLPDGRPVGIWTYDIPRWQPWYGHGGGPGFPGGAPLTGLSRDDGHMDLFGVAYDGRIHLAWWNRNPWREWYPLSDAVFPPGAQIAALSRNADQTDIFAVDNGGAARSNWWNGDPWRDWFVLDGAHFPPGASIAAISRNDDQMDIFAVASDGVVRSNWWNGNPWRGWFALDGADFPPGASIAAATRNDDQMDVFAIGYDGVVRSNWWNGNPWRGWFELGGATFPPGAPLAALALTPDWMIVAAIALDGQARLNVWRGNWSGWRVLPGAAFPPGASLAAHGGLFAVATDGYVRGSELGLLNPYWYRVG